MLNDCLGDNNIKRASVLPTPAELKAKIPLSSRAKRTVLLSRLALCNILSGADHRLLVIVGPCSIHDLDAAREYAKKLRKLARKVQRSLFLVMRVYVEKPRTCNEWKGLISDPCIDGSFRVAQGLYLARELLADLAELGVPAATEALDPQMPQFFGDLISWTAIGARTVESQIHRQLASGLSAPVGFKNTTHGDLTPAVNAICTAAAPQQFLGTDDSGKCTAFQTSGNPYTHLVLRGGMQPNYDIESIKQCEHQLTKAGLRPNIVVDCSHGNSLKRPELQPLVLERCIDQIVCGNSSIKGFMLESNLDWGSQSIPVDRSQLRYGVSVTDPCIDWKTTEIILTEAHARLRAILPGRLNRNAITARLPKRFGKKAVYPE